LEEDLDKQIDENRSKIDKAKLHLSNKQIDLRAKDTTLQML